MSRRLLYVADPMCSWCYGFAPIVARIGSSLRSEVPLRYVMGGLAPDTDEPMPAETRRYVQAAWDAVERATGAHFERSFWEQGEPRRSTWPACRACLAAESLRPGSGPDLFRAIQQAYYREARNPSLAPVLAQIAVELFATTATPVTEQEFLERLGSARIRADLAADFALRDEAGARAYPSLVLEEKGSFEPLLSGWRPESEVLALLAARGLLDGP